MESLYRAYTARRMIIQGPTGCDQSYLLTTSSAEVLRFLRVLLCSILYTDFGELPFYAVG